MNAHTTMKRGWRFAQVAAMAAALLGSGACDSPEPLPTPPDVQIERVDVFSSVSPSYVGIGEPVLVTVDFISTHTDDAHQRAHVSWDPATFEYVQPMPPESSRYLDQEITPGGMDIYADLTVLRPKTRITLLFRALANTRTSGISVYPHAAPLLP